MSAHFSPSMPAHASQAEAQQGENAEFHRQSPFVRMDIRSQARRDSRSEEHLAGLEGYGVSSEGVQARKRLFCFARRP